MVRLSLLLLIFLLLCRPGYGKELKVCVVNSYDIPPAKRLEEKVVELLKERGYEPSCGKCRVKIVIGTPGVVKELKEKRFRKLIFTFVLFPEELYQAFDGREVYGVRIFPLPERTVKAFASKRKLKKIKVAVPVSKEMEKIARRYLPDEYFEVLPFKDNPTEVFNQIVNYRFVYIFPDPKLLKLVNLLRLIDFGKENGIVFLSGLGDLKKYGVDFVQEVSYQELARKLVDLVESSPKERILPCPVER